MCCLLQIFGVASEALTVDSTDIYSPLADLPMERVGAVHWQDFVEDLMVELAEFLGFWEVLVDVRVADLQLWYEGSHTNRTHPLQEVQTQE
jgi:hypothetical protein